MCGVYNVAHLHSSYFTNIEIVLQAFIILNFFSFNCHCQCKIKERPFSFFNSFFFKRNKTKARRQRRRDFTIVNLNEMHAAV